MPDIANPDNLQLGALITGLGGGLALFLFGMRQMTESLKVVAGNSMKKLLAKLTANKFTAALAGTIVTAVVQSSSVTTVLVVGFISAGLLTLSQSIGVIIGANVGTTITAQIIAFQVYKYGLLMIAVGFLIDIFSKQEKPKQWGMALMGLGLIFFGMELMSNATGPLRQWPPFISALQNMQNPLLAILIGAGFTAIVQSSSATTGIVIVLASQGLVSLESGIGLCFGANVGTCVTAVLSSFGRPREAVQAAWVHVVFNLGGVLLWMFFIPQFADLVRSISPISSGVDAAKALATDTPRQIANAHTLFNLGNASLFIWFTGPLAKLVERIVPKRSEPEGIKPQYLDNMFLDQPALALDQVRRELVRLAEMDRAMLRRSLSVVTEGSAEDIQSLIQADDDVDTLYGEIVSYLGKLSQKNLIAPLSSQLNAYIGIANYLENVGDVIENNMVTDARKRNKLGVVVGKSTIAVLRPVHDKTLWAFERIIMGLKDGEHAALEDASNSKQAVYDLADLATAHLAKRLSAYESNRLAAFHIETGIVENLQRINNLTRRIGKELLKMENGNPDTQQPIDASEQNESAELPT